METENATRLVTARIVQMTDKRGFRDLFWTEFRSGEFKKYEDCYDALETEYQQVMLRRRYANFESFKTVMYK